jgi:hypothetical protein
MAPIDALFPSARWFAELVASAKADQSAMERLGIAGLRLGLEIVDDGHPQMFGIVLDGYDVESLGDVDEEAFAPEVVVSGPSDAWREMISSIEANGSADAAHTLNSLTITGLPFSVRAGDAMGHDKFFRYMGTLQAIFDAAGTPATVSTGR